MEKRGEGKEGVPVLALAKCLLVSYVLTLLLLCLLALLLYKLASDGRYSDDCNLCYLCSHYFYGGGFCRKKEWKRRNFFGELSWSGIFCDTGGGVRADQDTGDRIGNSF